MGESKIRTALLIIIFIISILVIGCSRESPKENKVEPVEVITQKVVKVEPVESVKQKVVAYLKTKGYKEEEFKVTVEYHTDGIGSFGGPYSINVIFNDEPNVIYNYRYNYNSELKDITQISISPMKDKKDKNFKHTE
jgi:hypothetical protein